MCNNEKFVHHMEKRKKANKKYSHTLKYALLTSDDGERGISVVDGGC